MSDFRMSFQKGQAAAEQADIARKEIDAVFTDLQNQMMQATEGKIKIERRKKERERSSVIPDVNAYFGIERSKYWAIVTFNPIAKDNTDWVLAEWEQSRFGYPCKVTWAGTEHSCHDRELLERSLSSMLEDATVGEKLLAILNLPLQDQNAEPEAKTDNAQD